MKIAIGSDHGGFELKETLRGALEKKNHDVVDMGCYDKNSVDYPDFGAAVASAVSLGRADRGIVICTTGIGISIAANRFPGVRSALCLTPRMAEMARKHNNANVLALGQSLLNDGEALAIVDAWLTNEFEGGRHQRRVDKIEHMVHEQDELYELRAADSEVSQSLDREHRRQRETLDLIAAENIAGRAVREALKSDCTNKYADGYPGRRGYPGCVYIDEIERLAMDRARMLFGAEHANVQPYGGSLANLAVMTAVLKPGDPILSMSPYAGGHPTHGGEEHLSGSLYQTAYYDVSPETELIQYDEIQRLAEEHKPRLICAGSSWYSRIIDFKKLRSIADSVGAYLLADVAHIGGLIAAGCHPNPAPCCEFVTMTTHKSLRGPRGGLILCQDRFADAVDRALSPGLQGGPLPQSIAAKAVCFGEALQPAFKQYQEQVVRNAQALADALIGEGFRLVSGGTDNHVMVVDITGRDVAPKTAYGALEKCGMLVNLVPVPADRGKKTEHGLRLGVYALTSSGFAEEDMPAVAALFRQALAHAGDKSAWPGIKAQAAHMMESARRA